MKKAPAGGPFSVSGELAIFDWQSEDKRSLRAGQAAPALPWIEAPNVSAGLWRRLL